MDLTSLTRGILKNHGISPDTGMDQHFMINRKLLERIVSAADIKKGEKVIEIGPGTGNLTRMLAKETENLVVIEKDPKLCSLLRSLFTGKKIRIVRGNALEYLKDNEFDKMVSNIPYAISEPLTGLLTRKDFHTAVLTVPDGFYRRISEEKSMLSLKVRCFFETEMICGVQRKNFFPVPETDSVLVKIRKLGIGDYREMPMEFLLKEIMLQRKKKLRNALMESLINLRSLQDSPITKNQSRKLMSSMGLERGLLGKRVLQMDFGDFSYLERKTDFVF